MKWTTRLCEVVLLVDLASVLTLADHEHRWSLLVAIVMLVTLALLTASVFLLHWKALVRSGRGSANHPWPWMLLILTAVAAQMSILGAIAAALAFYTNLSVVLLLALYLASNMVGCTVMLLKYGNVLERQSNRY